MKKKDHFERYLEKQLKDPEFRKEWEALNKELKYIECAICIEGGKRCKFWRNCVIYMDYLKDE